MLFMQIGGIQRFEEKLFLDNCETFLESSLGTVLQHFVNLRALFYNAIWFWEPSARKKLKPVMAIQYRHARNKYAQVGTFMALIRHCAPPFPERSRHDHIRSLEMTGKNRKVKEGTFYDFSDSGTVLWNFRNLVAIVIAFIITMFSFKSLFSTSTG